MIETCHFRISPVTSFVERIFSKFPCGYLNRSPGIVKLLEISATGIQWQKRKGSLRIKSVTSVEMPPTHKPTLGFQMLVGANATVLECGKPSVTYSVYQFGCLACWSLGQPASLTVYLSANLKPKPFCASAQ